MESDNNTSESESLQSDIEDNEGNEANGVAGNAGLADALSKVLKEANKKHGKTVVLSKAKLYSGEKKLKKDPVQFEIVPDSNRDSNPVKTEDVKPDLEDIKPDKKDLRKCRMKKQEMQRRGRVKPSALDREKERPLMKIATKGVVQLFNAVRQQQVAINKQIDQKGITETKKEKILKSIDKKAFLDVISKPVKIDDLNGTKEEPDETMEIKDEESNEPTWQVLRDDFMMGTKLKDWDRKEEEIEEED